MYYCLKRLRGEAEVYKSRGNEQFKAGDFQESAQSYTLGLRTCPLAFDKDRAVMYSNRAAANMKLVSICLLMLCCNVKMVVSKCKSDNDVPVMLWLEVNYSRDI